MRVLKNLIAVSMSMGLSLFGVMSINQAQASDSTAGADGDGVYSDFGDAYPHDPEARRQQLEIDGFYTIAEEEKYGRSVETFRKHLGDSVAVEYDVLGDANHVSTPSFINFEWDWGPRIYMTGEEFWSLGASGFAGAVCGFLGKSPQFGAACSAAATAAWNKMTTNKEWAHDKQCYDLSQYNIGWGLAPQEKCA